MPADPTIPELVARLRELHNARCYPTETLATTIREDQSAQVYATSIGPMRAVRPVAETTVDHADLIAETLNALPAILDALDHVGDAAAHSPDGGKEEGEPGFLSSDGVCPFCNCYADTPHTWRDCAHDLRETAQGLAEQAERVTRDSVAAISRVRGRLAEFRLRVSESAGCTRVVTDVTPEPFTAAASDDVALETIRGLRERATWRPTTEPPTAEEHAWCGGHYLIRYPDGAWRVVQFSTVRALVAFAKRYIGGERFRWLPIPPTDERRG